MNVNKIQNTCTMIEIGNISQYEIHSTTKLIKLINRGLKDMNKPLLYEDNYMIMYNGYEKIIITKLKRLGFKKVASYKGHQKIQVLMWQPNKVSLWQKIKNSFY